MIKADHFINLRKINKIDLIFEMIKIEKLKKFINI